MEFRVSPSKMSRWASCPALYYYEYVLELPPKPSVALLKGTIVHRILEDLARTCWDSIRDHVVSETMLKTRFSTLVQDFIDREYEAAELEVFCADNDEDFGEAMRDVARNLHGWVTWYVMHFFTHVDVSGHSPYNAWRYLCPTNAEQEIVVDTDMEILRACDPIEAEKIQGYLDKDLHIPVKLKGIIDAVFQSENGILEVRDTGLVDYKTSKIFQQPIDEDHYFQLLFYAYLWQLQTGKLPDFVQIHFLRTLDRPYFKPPENTEELVLEKVHIFIAAIQERFFPGNPQYKWCDFKTKKKHIQCHFMDECKREGRFSGDKVKGDRDPDWEK